MSFYMVLPSNGCQKTQPDNEAYSYIIDFENTVEFKKKWEVALTEFSFNTPYQYIYHDMDFRFSMEKPIETIISVLVKNDVLYLNGEKDLSFDFEYFTILRSAHNQLQIINKIPPLILKFSDDELALKVFGLKSRTYEGERVTGSQSLKDMPDFETYNEYYSQ